MSGAGRGRLPGVSIIVAIAANGVIGQGNRLPWHLPEDLAHFKRLTLGKPVVMGRRTFISIGRPLPGRRNIVVTSGEAPAGTERAGSLTEALALGRGTPELVVIGGARLFAEALPIANRLHITEIHRDYEGDVTFPPFDTADWRETSREYHPGAPAFSFVSLERR